MSLFDTVICEYPLPLPKFTEEETEDLRGDQESVNWSELEWQTKDMENLFDVYTIEEDGQIYRRKTDWKQDEDLPVSVASEGGELEKYERTNEIDFYNIILGEKHDHWLEFKAIVWKGDLKELELVEYKKEDNSDRKEYQEKMQLELEKDSRVISARAEEEKKWWAGFYKVYRFCLSKSLSFVRWIALNSIGWLTDLIIRVTMKIERWLP